MEIIQQAVHDTLFSRVAAASTAKETWEILKMEFQGDSQVQAVKLQSLRRDFENLFMKEGEVVGNYFGRVMALVIQKRAYGETIADQVVVEKILRSLTSKFDYVVPSIEINYDLFTLTPTTTVAAENESNQEDVEKFFMALTDNGSSGSDVHLWFLDSGASNHMTGAKECFFHLDESYKVSVKLGDKKVVQGKGTVKITTPNGNTKFFR
ncbi:uncharacterized protein LOC143589017 [Bidens hawaiensis]|uniref:uncharacterized protein LOC143589017 n=1 Tax=Bidens hawaiensis TaxID=980011 RepID=UPI00404AE458